MTGSVVEVKATDTYAWVQLSMDLTGWDLTASIQRDSVASTIGVVATDAAAGTVRLDVEALTDGRYQLEVVATRDRPGMTPEQVTFPTGRAGEPTYATIIVQRRIPA